MRLMRGIRPELISLGEFSMMAGGRTVLREPLSRVLN
jgi:hypothetical protein